MRLLFVLLLAIICNISYLAEAQITDPYEIINKILDDQSRLPDYEVDVEIEVDVEFIRMPVKTARMTFKQPDNIKFKSDDFLMLPKRGLNQSILDITSGGYDAVITGSESIDGRLNWIIKVIPLKHDEIILSTFWVDQEKFLINKAENFSRSGGVYLVNITYYPQLNLPEEIQVTFEVKEFKIPLDLVNRTIEIDEEKLKTDEIKTGRVYLRFKDYKFSENSGQR